MTITEDIFRAYDIRGIVETALTPDAVQQIGQAFATEALSQNQKTVVIARDGRLSSPELAQRLSEGLRAGGCNVIDIGMVPTPVLYYATHKLNSGEGTHTEKNIVPDYLDTIVNDIKLEKPLNIAVDCGNGVAGVLATELFTRLGCKVTELFCEVDGNFPNHHPDPSKPENLVDLQNAMKQNALDVGLAFDGDGDRVGILDDKQNILWADRQMMLYSADVLKRKPGALIIYDIKSTTNLGIYIKKLGGEPMMWKTGHSFIKARMKETGAELAGEMSGHIFFKERWFGFDDGLYSAARMLEIISQHDEPTSAIFEALPDSFNTPELQINFDEGQHYKFMNKFIDEAEFEDADIITIDGIRVNYADGWGLVRPSNTTPCLVLRFEANDENTLKEIQDTFRKQLLAVDSTLSLPF